MQYFKLTEPRRHELMQSLAVMPLFLREVFATLSPEEARLPGPYGTFSPVEQVWHLADLEREGFALRIRRLRTEIGPVLANFDGATLARERDYKSLSLLAGLATFEASRRENISSLQSLAPDEWTRSGMQEGVGPVMLCDIPAFLQQHDEAHTAEINEWRRTVGRSADA